ncbi:MAG TPA: hypothetical protein VEB42_00770, partial [Chitinophagaceae bacterium]|nr:hypothetical protein [Chitinophagaceae bacterium]
QEVKLWVCPTCVHVPDAKAEHNFKSSGVYKGIMVGLGSSGTIAVNLHNTGTEKKAVIKLNGKSAELTTNSLTSWQPGQAIDTALFTGTWNGQPVEMRFSVDTNGFNSEVQFDIPGKNILPFIYKETSDVAIESFEGDYTGDAEGVFNIAVNGNDITIIFSGIGIPMPSRLEQGKIDFTSEAGMHIKGNFYDDEAGGTWQNNATGKSGGWKALRTQ